MLSLFLVPPGLPSAARSALDPANPPERPEDIAITACYNDANANGNQCGEAHSATCTNSDGRGECCSAGGNCGTGYNFCGPDSQVEFSHSNNLCEDGMASDGFMVPEDEKEAAEAAAKEAAEKAKEALGCFTDANVGSLQCGPVAHATCTGGDRGKDGDVCCSSAGYCGSGDTFCGDGMQVEYSHGKNLCEAPVAVGQAEGQQANGSAAACRGFACPGAPVPECLTVEQVAKAWVRGVSPLSKADAEALCVPAVIIAAGSAFHTIQDGWISPCMGKFDPLVEADGFDGTRKGLWQISLQFFDTDDPDPEKQAATAYDVYTGDNADYGCLAEWCVTSTPGCSAVIPGIGQDDPSVTESRRFCHGVWSGAQAAVDNKLSAIAAAKNQSSGEEIVRAACAKALQR